MWHFDNEISFWLKLFTGELNPSKFSNKTGINTYRDERRLFLNELPIYEQSIIVNFFSDNKIIIVNDIMKGRGGLSADWMLVTKNDVSKRSTSWFLCNINIAMNFFGSGSVNISPKGSLKIGKITMQRKGGTPDPTKLQFKIKPCQIFEIEERIGSK